MYAWELGSEQTSEAVQEDRRRKQIIRSAKETRFLRHGKRPVSANHFLPPVTQRCRDLSPLTRPSLKPNNSLPRSAPGIIVLPGTDLEDREELPR